MKSLNPKPTVVSVIGSGLICGTRFRLIPFAALFTIACYGQETSGQNPTPSTAPQEASKEQAVLLPEYQVTGNKANQYSAENAASVARIASSITDSPMTVNVISPALLQDLGTTVMLDAVTYFAGMSPGRATGPGEIQDRMNFRGFEDIGGQMVDDFCQYLQPSGQGPHGNLDPAFIDHAELVMGPDAILSPTGSPGGSINVFTKSPLFTRSTDISVQYGNYLAGGASIDTTGPIGDGKHMAYRVISDYQEYRAFMPGSVKMASACAEFTYKFSDTAKVMFKYITEAYLPTGEVAMAGEQGQEVFGPNSVRGATLPNTPTPGFTYGGWNGIPTWGHIWDRVNIYEAELTAALSQQVNMRLAAQVLCDNCNTDNAYPNTLPAESFDQVTGEQIAVAQLNPAALTEIANYNHILARDIQVQNDFAGRFTLKGVTLQPLVGWDYEQFETTQWAIQDKNMPLANILGQSDGPSYTPYNPPHPPYSAYTSFAVNLPENGWFWQGYGLVRASFLNDRLFLTGSFSRTWASVNEYTFNGVYINGVGQVGGTAPATQHTFSNTGVAVSPYVKPFQNEYIYGIVAKPLPNVSLYSSVSTNASIAGNVPLWQTGKQFEYGVKADFFKHRLSTAIDHFQVTENNISVSNPLYATGQSSIVNILSNETNHGIEVNVSGGITPELSVIVSYTNMKFRDAAQRRVRNVPDNMANLLVNYHWRDGLLKDASAFLGIQHLGEVAGENAPNLGYTSLGAPQQVGYYIAAWTVAHAGVSYQWQRYRFNLNVNNLLNQKFWWQPSSRLMLLPYPARAIRLSATMHL